MEIHKNIKSILDDIGVLVKIFLKKVQADMNNNLGVSQAERIVYVKT